MNNVVSRSRAAPSFSTRRWIGRAAAAVTAATAALVLAGATGLGCDDNKGTFEGTNGPTGTSVGTGPGGSKGIGEACAASEECRKGLACEAGACAPGHIFGAGEPCTLGGECQDGLYCAEGICAAAGDGKDGAGCASDADCASGYCCALVGLSAQCVPEGKGDIDASCSTSNDCYGGLGCFDGKCSAPPAGSSPFGPMWPGVECAAESGPVQAYFRVPRGMDDGDFYRLPFPNDVRLKNGKPDLTGHPTPGKDLLGYDLVDRYLRAIEQDNDGWGMHHWTFFRFSGELDYENFANINAVFLVNLTANQGMGLYYLYSVGGGSYICPNWLAVRTGTGAVFNPGDTYAVYLNNELKAKGGAPISRSPDFDAMLADAGPPEAELAAEWPKYAPLRDYFTAHNIDKATILTASVFTVGHPRAPVEKVQKNVAAAGPPAITGNWVKCDAGVASPCSDATGDRACAAADPDFDELHALVSLPIYQDGAAPYLNPEDGGLFKLDVAGDPVEVGKEDVCVSLTVPKGQVPAGGWPTVVFAHETAGHFRSHVTRGVAKELAVGVDDGSGNVVKAAVIGIDQIDHGPRRGTSTMSPNDLVWNFSNPKAVRGNLQQGAADQMALFELVQGLSFDDVTSPTGAAFSLAAGQTAFWGHAQGAVQGAMALPYGLYTGAVLSGERGSYIDMMLNTTSPMSYATAIPVLLSDLAGDGTLRGGAAHPVLSLIQTYLDGADALSYAKLAAKTPPMGGVAHHLFQPYGLSDTYSPAPQQQIFAVAAGLGLCEHDPSVATPDDIAKLTEIPPPASGNLMVGGKPVTALLRQYAIDGKEGHFVVFDVPSARDDAERFLAGALMGGVPVVGK